MPKTARLSAFLWLLGVSAAMAAPEGLYRGPGYFPGYYGGYLYGYHPGPALPPPGDETIVCVRVFIADRFVWQGNRLVSDPLTDKACRAVRQPLEYRSPELILKR